MKKYLKFLLFIVAFVLFHSCNIDEEITIETPPQIILESSIYSVKQGREIIIAPLYKFAEDATYCWTMEGEAISCSPSLSFTQENVGEYFITIAVSNNGGYTEEEIRIDVVELEIPTVSIAGNKNITVASGTELTFSASVRETSIATTLIWRINGQEVGKDKEYTFITEVVGSYTITATASNDDGSHSDSVTVDILSPENMPFVWEFNRKEYHTIVGRKLQISPTGKSNSNDIDYSWKISGEEKSIGNNEYLVFTAENIGEYKITATATSKKQEKQFTLIHEFTVTVYDGNINYRPKSSSSKAEWNRVYEYTPAPGQFINETKTGGFDGSQTTAEAARLYSEKRLTNNDWVSLGGFGGYIIIGFDHSIENNDGYDLAVIGNAFDGSSEPAVVWVMQDENGDGQPNDTWYELAGSESYKNETICNYEVTYYRPTAAGMSVQWQDNMGDSGTIDYLRQFHTQDYYYPLWIEADSYTLRGTRLEARNYDKSGNGSYWVNPHYDWGYVDNYSPIDFVKGEMSNLFDIDNAIDFEGESIELKHIDFIKVQSAINGKSGWLGEISTEVCGFYDYTLKNEQ